jgi:hypothetical protein
MLNIHGRNQVFAKSPMERRYIPAPKTPKKQPGSKSGAFAYIA